MSERVKREERRLRRVFGAIVLAASAPAAGEACSSSSSPSAPDAGDRIDASMSDESLPPVPDGAAPADASDASIAEVPDVLVCWPDVFEFDAGDAGPDVLDRCIYRFSCGLPLGLTTNGCEVQPGAPDGALSSGPIGCRLIEGQGCTADAFAPEEGGALAIDCSPCLTGGGRRPAGLRRVKCGAKSAIGAYFARMAHDEAASVEAFARMRDELARWGAPRELGRAAERAILDEARHARAMARLARRYGETPPAPRLSPRRARSLEAMARENAVEGCVRETFGALVAVWQAAHARDPEVARAMKAIARDETRHAALSRAVGRWLERRLDPAARVRTVRRRAEEERRIARSAARAVHPELVAIAGLPSAATAVRLIDRAAPALWPETAPASRTRRGTGSGDRRAEGGRASRSSPAESSTPRAPRARS
jgi:hypothetical protein